jgi:hypothetical protein
MKPRTKEENAAYARAQREKKRLAAVSPHVSPAATPCLGCQTKDAEISRLVALTLDMEKDYEKATQVNTQEITRLTASITALEAQAKRHATPDQPPKGNDLEALQQRVIAAKVNRINNYGRNPVIGKAAL